MKEMVKACWTQKIIKYPKMEDIHTYPIATSRAFDKKLICFLFKGTHFFLLDGFSSFKEDFGPLFIPV